MRKVAAVVGLGVSGLGAARLLAKKGWEVRVTEAQDTAEIRRRARALERLSGVRFELGRHTKGFIEGAGLVVASPGVKDGAQPLVWARQSRIPVIDEIELGYRYCAARMVAVTGTNGKSTTASLIGEVLKAGGLRVEVCGNIGVSFCERAAAIDKETVVVLELSSFQLQRIVEFRPYVSVFLNITQNHLDRHRDFGEYLGAKLNIFKNQRRSDWAVLNCEDKALRHIHRHIRPRILYFGDSPGEDVQQLSLRGAVGAEAIPKVARTKSEAIPLRGLLRPFGARNDGEGRPPRNDGYWTTSGAEGACLRDGAIYLVNAKGTTRFLAESEVALRGGHNLRNVMASILVGRILKVGPGPIREAIRNFKGLEHRCEIVGEIDNVAFINDSKATTVEAAVCAIRSIDRPIILIAGGRDKGSDFTVLKPIVEERVKAVVLLGEASQKIRTQLLGSGRIYEADDLEGAVRIGFDLANRGEAVLFSPMCASFDMFRNFEERGTCFKKAVMSLKVQIGTDVVARRPRPALRGRADSSPVIARESRRDDRSNPNDGLGTGSAIPNEIASPLTFHVKGSQ